MNIKRPMPTGRYIVGTRLFTVNTEKKEILSGHTDEIRRLSCRIWYPADPEDVKSRKKAEYLNRYLAEAVKADYEKSTADGKNSMECYADAEYDGGRFPLLIYNHGYTSYKETNSFLCIDLASHGYVVVAPEHPYESQATVYDDGTVIRKDPSITKRCYEPMIPALVSGMRLLKKKGTDEEIFRAFDEYQHRYSRFMIGRLDAWCEDTEVVREYVLREYADIIDTEKGIGLTGLSFGGAVSYSLLRKTEHYVCGINIDGGLFGEYEDTTLSSPFMNITSEEHRNLVAGAFIDAKADMYAATFQEMKHLGFGDLKFFIRKHVGKLPPMVLHENLCRCHLLFFDKYLKGEDIDMKISEEKVSLVRR